MSLTSLPIMVPITQTWLLCKNYMKLRKNTKFISSCENTPFDEPEIFPRKIKLRLKIEGVFFSQPIPNLHMADKSAYFTRFSANLVLNTACAILSEPPNVGPYYTKIFTSCPYIVKVYIFWSLSDFASAQKSWSLSDWHPYKLCHIFLSMIYNVPWCANIWLDSCQGKQHFSEWHWGTWRAVICLNSAWYASCQFCILLPACNDCENIEPYNVLMMLLFSLWQDLQSLKNDFDSFKITFAQF